MYSLRRRAAALVIVIAVSAATASCRDLFSAAIGAVYVRTDLVLAWLMRPAGPAVTFTSPADGGTGVAVNQSVIVCFSEPVVLTPGTNPFRVEMIDAGGTQYGEDAHVTTELSAVDAEAVSSDTIQIVPPVEGYGYNRRYRVVMVDDIFTAQGEPVDPGGYFPLEFTTGADNDTEPPRVTATVPLDYQSTDHRKPVITVQFDDDVVPASGTLVIYRYDHEAQKPADEPERIEYDAAYAGASSTIAFALRGGLEEYRIYQAVVSGVRDTSRNVMKGNLTGEGAAPDRYEWRFFTGPVVVAVQPASNHVHGFGTFGNPGEMINGVVAGYELLDRTAAIIHGRVGEGGQLSTFFDTTSGEGFPDDVSAIRILHNGRNLAGDLGLTPVCRSISGPTMAPPPKGVFYVDPRWGRFLLPRPAYWSKMESDENVTTGAECRLEFDREASNNEPYMIYKRDAREGNYEYGDDHVLIWLSKDEYGFGSVGGLPAGGKFGNCFTMFWESDSTQVPVAKTNTIKSRNALYPFGDQIFTDFRQGTVSFWGMLDTYVETHSRLGHESSGESCTEIRLAPAPGLIIKIKKYQGSKIHGDEYYIIINNVLYGSIDGMMMHFYLTWVPSGTAENLLLKIVISDVVNPENILSIENIVEYRKDEYFKPYIELFGNTKADFKSQSLFARSLARAWCQMDNIKWFINNVSNDPAWEYKKGIGREEALHPVYGPESEYALKPIGSIGVGYFFIPY